MNQKHPIAVVLGAATIAIAAAASLGCQRQSEEEEVESPAPSAAAAISPGARSVLVVTVDTTRPDRLEPYGAENVATPVLQGLANEGIVFESASAVAPITLVAHTSILTGRYPFEHGVRNNGIQYVPDSATTLAERLRAEDYRTAAFVSAAVLDERYGLGQGFEVYDDDLSERTNVSPRMVADRPAGATIAAAKRWLDEVPPDENFFLWVHLYDPHASYSPPPPFRDDYRDRLYDGEIAYMDQQIGALLEHRRVADTASPAAPVVMVIGDHGESLGEHGERTHAILAYDSTIHIPWIVRIPGGPAGRRVREPVGQVDLMPTVISLLGLDPVASDEEMAGRDLTSLVEGRGGEPQRSYYSETFLPYYTYGWAKLRVLRRGRWKYIDAPTPELYNLVRDPRELTSISGHNEGLVHDMERDLGEWLERDESGDDNSLALSAEDIARLASLGYVAVGSGTGEDIGERPNPMEMIGQHVGLERARQFLADRLFAQAERQLRSVLEHDPNNLAALLDLVWAEEGQGNTDEAIELAERALERDPDYLQSYLVLARLLQQKGMNERALEVVELAIRRDPQHPNPRVQQAMLLQRLRRPDEAKRVLDEALERHPNNARVNTLYAQIVEARSGELAAAETRLQRVVETDPFVPQAWFYLGQVQTRQGKLAEARQSFRRGLAARPDDVDLHSALGQLLARIGEPELAIVQLREAIRLSPRLRTETHVTLGAVLAEMGRLDEARREYDRVLEAEPRHPGARNNAAIALYRTGRTDEAIAQLRSVVEDFPRQADAYNNLAAIAVDQGRWAEVVRQSRKSIELAPDGVEAWNNLGVGLEETRRRAEAVEAYEHALELQPDYWPAWFNLAELFKKMGRSTDAIRAYEEVLTRVPNHADTHLAMGELYAGPIEDPARARTHWNAFLRHASGHPRASEVRRRLTEI